MRRTRDPTELSSGALAVGMLIAGATGFALWMVTETFVFFPAFLGMGVVIGLIVQSARNRHDS